MLYNFSKNSSNRNKQLWLQTRQWVTPIESEFHFPPFRVVVSREPLKFMIGGGYGPSAILALTAILHSKACRKF